MFTVAWPIGLILLLIKLSESGNKKKNAQRTTGQSGQRTSQRVGQTAQAEKARTAVKQVTQTPDYSDKGAKTMKIIGAVVGILGAFFLVQQVDYFELRYAIKWHDWMDLLRQVLYPMGMMAGGVSLLLGSGAMKRRQRRFGIFSHKKTVYNVIHRLNQLRQHNRRCDLQQYLRNFLRPEKFCIRSRLTLHRPSPPVPLPESGHTP